ncbi:hypothetical protein HQ585_00435 [candidate division KSB1 bacterium]|nr:hypothetical protein [candidate division KSB1 bacterium]
MRIRKMNSFIGLLIIGFMIMSSVAFSQMTARGLGLAGAYTALARGVHAPSWNPANLGLPDNPNFTFTFIGLDVNMTNNSFSQGTLNKYSGQHLYPQDIADILDRIPDSGLDLDIYALVRGLSFSTGRFALTFDVITDAMVQIDKEIFELIFTGNEIDKTYMFEDMDGKAWGVGSIGLSYGHPIEVEWAQAFAVGATLKLLYGGAYGQVDDAKVALHTERFGFNLDGNYKTTFSQGSMGWGTNLGAAAQIDEKWTVSAGFQNLLGSIPFNKEMQTDEGYFNGDSLTIMAISDDDEEEDVLVDSVWTVKGGSFSKNLPIVFRAGCAYREGNTLLVADYSQGFQNTAIVSKTPRLSFGTEWQGVSWLPLRMGVVLGGRTGFGTSLGFGIHPGGFVMDIGMLFRGFFVPNTMKGFALGLDIGLELN